MNEIKMFQNRLRSSVYLKVIIIIFILLSLFNLPVLKRITQDFEYLLLDLQFNLAKNEDQSKEIVIVDIDSSSIQKLNQWPWPRVYWGKVINNLNKYGAKVIGIDVLFDNPSNSTSDDQQFSEILKQNPNVVLASRRFTERKSNYEIQTWSNPIDILSNHSSTGFINFPYDKDGTVRRSFVGLSQGKTKTINSFSLEILSYYRDKPSESLISFLSNFYDTTNILSTYWVNFNLSNSFKRVPFYRVLEGRVQDKSIFENKIVLIGATDPILNDIIFTPIGLIPGVDIHGYNLLTLDQQKPIRQINSTINSLTIGIFLMIILISTLRFRGGKSLIITLSSVCIYSIFVIFMFNSFRLFVLWAPLILLGFSGYLIATVYKLTTEEREKKFIRSIFSQYVSPEVVKNLIQHPESLKLGGQKKNVSIFFSDIRSFTALSEKYPAEEIVAQLNEYLDAMTQCVFKWKGTLDKYVGDEIMAVWGAPLDQDDHATRAVCCSWEQLKILKRLQEKWKREGRILFDIGIGINSGNVIVGNIGSTQHKDYTVIGDAVNYAARLEALTRDYSSTNHICRFIISESVYLSVKSICEVKPLGIVSVKGKEERQNIYEVIDVQIPDTFKDRVV